MHFFSKVKKLFYDHVQMESMSTEAECYCAKLSITIFLAKCCGKCQNNFLADCAKTNKQQSSNTADMQQSINVHLCTPRHPNPSTGTAWHTYLNNTHRRPSTTNDTRPHKNTHASQQGMVGRDRTKILGNSTFYRKGAQFHLTRV